MIKVAYALFLAFLGSILTFVVVWALLPSEGTEPGERPSETLRPISLEELGDHDHRESCWKAIDGKVYDVTDYIAEHPAPERVFVGWCGREATEAWNDKGAGRTHSPAAKAMLQQYLTGALVEHEESERKPDDTPLPEDESRTSPSDEVAAGTDGVAAQGLPSFPDGRYRGSFGDRGYQQVSLQFYLEDNLIRDISFRHLYYADVDYLQISEERPLHPVLRQHEQMVAYLEGKPGQAIFDLHSPENVVEDLDGFTGATVRSSKVISAMRDVLNRGIY